MNFTKNYRNHTKSGIPCPCTPDCKDRSATCHANCPHGYSEYRKQKNKDSDGRIVLCNAKAASFEGIYKNKARRAKDGYGY